MPSRTAFRRDRIARAVIRGARNNVELVHQSLQSRLEEDGVFEALQPGDEPILEQALSEDAVEAIATLERAQKSLEPFEFPDWDQVQKAVAWVTAFYTRLYLILDDVHQQEAAEDWVPRDRRDEAVASAYEDLVAVRRYVAGMLDERAANSLLGLTDRTPRQPDELRMQMEMALRRLKDPTSHVPKPRIEGLEPDWEPAIRQLERGLETLDAALENLADEAEAIRQAQALREEALTAHRDMVSGGRAMLRGMYVMAGRRDLAASIRSPFRRRLSDADLDEDDDFPFGEPPDEEGDEPATNDVPTPGEEGEEVEP